ncbi:hypothetical protein [Bacillus sp. PK5-004]
MINRLIYNGKVYYKVADLAQLFDVSIYKIRKIVKTQDIRTTLKGYGRAVFVLEENVAKIEVRNEVKILETKFTADPVKKSKVVKEPVVDVKKSKKPSKKVKKEIANNVAKFPEEKVEVEATPESVEKLQEEHEQLINKGNALGVKLAKADKFSICREITEKHLGQGAVFRNATLDDILGMRAIVADLEVEVVKLKGSPNVVAEVKISNLSNEIENDELIESPSETESITEQQVGAW